MFKRIKQTIIIAVAITINLNAIELKLKNEAHISSDYVYMNDIFHVKGKVQNIALFKKPKSTSHYSLIEVLNILDKHLANKSYTASGKGVTLIPKSKSVNTNVLSKRILDDFFLDNKNKIQNAEYKIRYLYKIPPIKPGNNDYHLILNFEKPGETGIQNVKVKLVGKNGKTITWFETVIEIFAVKKVYVAKGYIKKGERIKKGMFRVEERRANRIPSDSVIDLTEAHLKNTKYYIKPGNIIRKFHINSDAIIKRGDNITVFYDNAGIHLEMRAVALENASEGDSINLKNPISYKKIKGVVKNGKVYLKK